MDLLTWLAKRGFASVSVSDRELLAQKLFLDVAHLKERDNYSEALTLALVMNILGDLDEAEAMELMLRTVLSEQGPSEDVLDGISDEMIHDFALLGEQSEAIALLKDHVKEREAKQAARKRAMDVTSRVFTAAKVVAKEGRKRAASAAAKAKAAAKEKQEREARQKRWYTELERAPMERAVADKPDSVHVFVDHKNGRFRISCKGYAPRSFSWTLRGAAEAARMALAEAWTWHWRNTGQRAPDHLDLGELDYSS